MSEGHFTFSFFHFVSEQKANYFELGRNNITPFDNGFVQVKVPQRI